MSAAAGRVSALMERILSGQQWRAFKTATHNYYHPMMRAGRSVTDREREREFVGVSLLGWSFSFGKRLPSRWHPRRRVVG